MKPFTNIICFLMINIAFVACFGKNGNVKSHDVADVVFSNKDTVIMSQKVPKEIAGDDVIEMEYYVKIKSVYYPLVVSASKTQYGMLLDFRAHPGDYSLKTLSDTSVVESKIVERNSLYLNSDEKYSLIRRMLALISNDFELNRVQYFFIDLSAFKEEMVEITKQYEQLYGLIPENITKKRMDDIIKKFELYKNLSKAHGRYPLKMGTVYVEDIK